MKLIFLDIDGVLNYTQFWKEKTQAERYKELPEDAPHGAHDICYQKIELLNNLIRDTGAKVVVSSSWRIGRTIDQLEEVLECMGFEGEIVGKTPHLYFQPLGEEKYNYSVPRGCEIKAWLELNKGILGDKMSKIRYVIFDDDSDMLYWQRTNFFWCDPYSGLTPNLIYKAKQFLNN